MKTLSSALIFLSLTLLAGCGKKHDHAHDHDHGHGHSGHGHHHTAPHGGTAVILGNEAFHLEFVQDPDAGTLTAYVLDAHMEDFVRIGEPAILLHVTVDGQTQPLALAAVANQATNETVGDTSQFQVGAEWLKRAKSFDVTIPSLTIRGAKFENVSFNFPKGNGK